MWRPSALAALFGMLVCSACIHVCAATAYQRPVNGDCLNVGGAGQAADVQLYPEQFMVVGDTQSQQGLYTQASAKGWRRACTCTLHQVAAGSRRSSLLGMGEPHSWGLC